LFVGLGKKYVATDILGKIYRSFFSQKKDFNQYFLGANIREKYALLNYAVYFLVAVIVLNFIAFLLNIYL
jgi:hypothetical protein